MNSLPTHKSKPHSSLSSISIPTKILVPFDHIVVIRFPMQKVAYNGNFDLLQFELITKNLNLLILLKILKTVAFIFL